MANKIWNYNIPVDYTYDSSKIEVSGGLVKLINFQNLLNPYTGWHLNEISGNIVHDFSSHGRDGTMINMEDADWQAGKLNNCLNFNEGTTNEYVNCGNIANFERTDKFSVETWIQTSISSKIIIARHNGTAGWFMYVDSDGKVMCYLSNNYGGSNNLARKSSSIVTTGVWCHIIFTYDGSSTVTGFHIYINGVLNDGVVIQNNLTSSILVGTDTRIGNWGGGGSLCWKGKQDEIVIYDKELSAKEVDYRYNSGSGRENLVEYPFDTSKPFIQPAVLFHADYMASFNHFLETLGAENQGQIKYILSNDGTIWRYWNGSVWTTGGNETNSNTITEVEAHIGTFPITEDITFRAYLISNGTQKVELDENNLDYLSNQYPYVYAGEDKACKDNTLVAPFSDAITYDPDGDTELSHAYYNIEGSGWIEIIKGVLTLQEAIRVFTYQFDNPGYITCQLKVIDVAGSSTTDTAILTVSKYVVTFNIKDEQGWYVPNLTIDFGDGNGWQFKSPPFTCAYEYGTYTIQIDKYGFTPLVFSLSPQITSTVDRVMKNIGSAVWDELLLEHTVPGSLGEEIANIKEATTEINNTVGSAQALCEELQNQIANLQNIVDGLVISGEERKTIQLNIQSISDEIKTNLISLESIVDIMKVETDKLSGIDDNVQSLENVADTIKTETNKITILKSLSEALQNQITELNNITENIKQIENGRWKCEGSQMKFYNENNEVIATFNLYDKDGHLTDDISKVVERRKV